MKTPVHQLDVIDPPSGVTAVLSDLLDLDLPGRATNPIAVAALEIDSWRISRMTRNGRVFDRPGFRDLLTDSTVTGGWFFFGAPGNVGDAVEPVDVPRLLERSAFVVDILEGRFLCARTVHAEIAKKLKEVIVDATEMGPCELEDVKLMY